LIATPASGQKAIFRDAYYISAILAGQPFNQFRASKQPGVPDGQSFRSGWSGPPVPNTPAAFCVAADAIIYLALDLSGHICYPLAVE